ncbi:MAG: DUF4277 domain-containing protein [Haliscomenobacter sp.]|nr:DUF4277 domain-containing protein [Haliscomenobacter sp.]
MEQMPTSKELNHLGLVAAMIDQLGIVERIDSRVPQDLQERHVSVGMGVKAMIITAWVLTSTLYMVSSFLNTCL